MLEREKEISFDVLVEAIEQALLDGLPPAPRAPRRTPASSSTARPATSPCCAAELDEEGNGRAEYDDTPEGFGRIAATTAKQVILQRLRDAEDELQLRRVLRQGGRHRLRRHPAGPQPRRRDGRPRQDRGGAAASASRCRARTTSTAQRIKCLRRRGPQGHARARRSRCRAPTPTWSRSCSRSRCPRSPTAPSRSRRSPARPVTAPRSRCASNRAGRQRQGRLHRPDGPAGPQRDDRAARREDRHRRLVRRPGRVRRRTRCRRRGSRRSRSSTPAARSARVVVPDFQLSLAIGKEGQNARLAARLTGWRIDIRSDDGPDAAPTRGPRRACPVGHRLARPASADRTR